MSTLVDKADEDTADDVIDDGDEIIDDEPTSTDDSTDEDDVIDDGEDDEVVDDTEVEEPSGPTPYSDIAAKDPTPLHEAFTEWILEQTGYEADLKTVQLAVVMHPRFQKSKFNKQRNAARIEAGKAEKARRAEDRAKAAEERKIKNEAAKVERERAAEEAKAAKAKAADEKAAKAAEKAAAAGEADTTENTVKTATAAKPGPKKAGQRGKTPTIPAATTRRRPANTEESAKADEEF